MSEVRYYFSLTNRCNLNCPFCCMNSGTGKSTFLPFDRFKEVLDSTTKKFELQLDGGEPLLHPCFQLFLEYAYYTGRCTKLTIGTNGKLLGRRIDELVAFACRTNIPTIVKASVNFHLLANNPLLIKEYSDIVTAVEFVPGFDIKFNVRLRREVDDSWIVDALRERHLEEKSKVFYLQRYGRYEEHNELDLPFINQNIDEWFFFASDGANFGHDLIARSNYEKTLK